MMLTTCPSAFMEAGWVLLAKGLTWETAQEFALLLRLHSHRLLAPGHTTVAVELANICGSKVQVACPKVQVIYSAATSHHPAARKAPSC